MSGKQQGWKNSVKKANIIITMREEKNTDLSI